MIQCSHRVTCKESVHATQATTTWAVPTENRAQWAKRIVTRFIWIDECQVCAGEHGTACSANRSNEATQAWTIVMAFRYRQSVVRSRRHIRRLRFREEQLETNSTSRVTLHPHVTAKSQDQSLDER